MQDVSNRYATFAAGPSVEAYLVKDEITFKTVDAEGEEKQSGWNLTLLKLSTVRSDCMIVLCSNFLRYIAKEKANR